MKLNELTAPQRLAARDALVGASLMNLLYVDVWRVLFTAKTPAAFFLTVARSHYFAALFVVVMAALISPLLASLMRMSPAPLKIGFRLAFLASLVILLDRLRKSSGITLPAMTKLLQPVVSVFGTVGVLAMAIVVIGVGTRYAPVLSRWYRTALFALSPFVAYTFIRAIWMAATVNFVPFADLPRPVRPEDPAVGRVVIVVFDELDYESLLLHHPADLSLPNFEALAATAVSFDSTVSPGANTLEAFTSYFYQHRVTSGETTGPRSIVAHLASGQRLGSDTANSFLDELPASHVNSAVIGFSLPYCRIGFARTADFCDWVQFGTGVSTGQITDGFWRIVGRQLESLHPYGSRRAHIRHIHRVLGESVQLASDSSYSLVFLHLPLPHLPAVWNRATRTFVDHSTSPDGYFDNLDLVDRTIGQLRAAMVERGTWDRTTFIVTSDHPMRQKLREGESTDHRIPLFVKLPGMTKGSRVSESVNSLFVTAFVPQFLAGQLSSLEELRAAVHSYMAADPSLRVPALLMEERAGDP